MTKPFSMNDDFPLPNGTLIEASAGTGKTHAVAQYVTKAIATDDALRIGEILVTTYTRNAAAELKERIRGRLIATSLLLKGRPAVGYHSDDLDDHLKKQPASADMARRLDRAAAEFDTAVIGTIHAVCSRLLRLGGVEAAKLGKEEDRDRVVEEVVNDAVVTEAVAGRHWDEKELSKLVQHSMSDPFLGIAGDPDPCPEEEHALRQQLRTLIADCTKKSRARMQASPSFDELLVLTWEKVVDQPADKPADKDRKEAFRQLLRDKFKLAIVDEAQDTNRLQWELFHAIFPPAGENVLVAVGDPKQAIYGFRGADVTAYVNHAQDGVPLEDGSPPRRTLTVNRRSDGPLLDGLNHVMEGATFGPGIAYQQVTSAPDRLTTQMAVLKPVEFLDVGQMSLADAAVRKVHEVLNRPHFKPTEPRAFKTREICVLVRANATGAAIARRLLEQRIPAVTEGTASVMEGQMAADMRCLLEAMEKPSDSGRARRAAATAFFGKKLAEVAQLEEGILQQIRGDIGALHATLQRHGVAAMAAEIMASRGMIERIAMGHGGDRRLVDFAHINELLNDASGGRGCHARQLLEHVAALANQDATAELVSRRVESDAEAVTIMTVHAAKGLQFPCVIVVDGWTPKVSSRKPEIFHRGGNRLMDISKVIPNEDIPKAVKDAARDAENEELRRLIYVAVTRPQHHLSILRTAAWQKSLLHDVLRQSPAADDALDSAHAETIAVRSAGDLPQPQLWTPDPATKAIGFAPIPPRVEQTYRRTSFSGIAKAVSRGTVNGHEAEGHGNDENTFAESAESHESSESRGGSIPDADQPTLPTTSPIAPECNLSHFEIPPLPAGTAFGTIAHDCLELIDAGPSVSEADLRSHVRQVVDSVATARFMQDHRDGFAMMLADAMLTPFGGPPDAPFRGLRFADFGKADRLVEMNFEMAMASLDSGVQARHVGGVLQKFTAALPANAPLARYAADLAGPQFGVPLAGLINGAIDAVFRLPGSTSADPRLLIADYKTNKLHERDAVQPLAAYAPAQLSEAMASHHYLLQSLVYGTAVWRMLRWRLGPQKPADWDPGECIVGVVYGFVRGMKGPDTPEDAVGGRYGVFTWQPPEGIWRRLSDLLAGDLSGVTR
jgi:exodeoxyribonuclease V beta subunit